MWLVKSPAGLKLSARGRKKAANSQLTGVFNETIMIPRRNGSGDIRARVYKPLRADGPLPVVLFFHGGGYATGWPERHHAFYERLMKTRPCIIVAPAFRLSIEAPYPAGHDDCYDSLVWLRDNAATLGGRSDAIILAGNSSGGGLALSTALRARDNGDPSPAFMMPLYPMIDDREGHWTDLPKDKITWSKQHGILAWHLLLKDVRAQKRYDIPAYAAPIRATDLAGLPPMLSYVGAHDILLNEAKDIAQRISDAGGTVTFRVFDDVFHAMEDSAPDLPGSRAVNQWLPAEFARLYDQHCGPAQPAPAS
jgi:acetyl esterase/lipase